MPSSNANMVESNKTPIIYMVATHAIIISTLNEQTNREINAQSPKTSQTEHASFTCKIISALKGVTNQWQVNLKI